MTPMSRTTNSPIFFLQILFLVFEFINYKMNIRVNNVSLPLFLHIKRFYVFMFWIEIKV